MAEDNQLDLTIIPDAGHNAHLENPTYFAEKNRKYRIKKLLNLKRNARI